MSGDDRYVADYLYREALSAAARGRSAVPAAHGGARSAVGSAVRCRSLGEPGSQERLRGLEASSLFLIPLDRRREWYRYHALFREFLLGELRRVEPDVIAKLHLRAADWYESKGSPAMALEHLHEHDRAGPMRPAGDRVGPPDLPGRPDVDRRAVALGARRRSRSRTIRRSRCWPAGSRC